MSDKLNHLLCFGFGFSCRVLATGLPRDQWTITGTSRSAEGCENITQLGFDAARFNEDTPLDRALLDKATHVIVSIPPGKAGDLVVKLHGSDLAQRAGHIKWLAYLSTTGVYGDRQGGWVDETSLLEPGTLRGAARLAAETAWLELWREAGLAVHLFRLAGIYGPGRNQLQSLKTGKARRIVKQDQVFSRIHVADIAGILHASMDRPNPGSGYNVCDDEAAPPQDVVAYAADLLGIDPPPEVAFEQADMSDMAKSFYAESKRVSNEKVKTELDYRFAYPTYREGLQALL